MKSKWFELKEEALVLRRRGTPIRDIEKMLGIPRSTLSGWFKNVELTPEQQEAIRKNRAEALARARKKAHEWHRNQKALRLLKAEKSAKSIMQKLELSPEVLDLAFAMLYYGEGSKKNLTSIASSDKNILLFVLHVLRLNYNISPQQIRCELHLRADQDPVEMKKHWSSTLNVPLENFGYTAVDQRTAGRKTYDYYKGVCVIRCGDISIQRKLTYLYEMFCDKVSKL